MSDEMSELEEVAAREIRIWQEDHDHDEIYGQNYYLDAEIDLFLAVQEALDCYMNTFELVQNGSLHISIDTDSDPETSLLLA